MRNNNIASITEELRQLKLREAELISSLEEQSASLTTTPKSFATGDRVYIKNRVRKPKAWSDDSVWNEAIAKRATVTKVTNGQVHFITDNGVQTWRAPGNLRPISKPTR